MSASSVNIGGQRRVIGLKPANTSEATMLTAGDDRPVIVGLVIANNTGGAVAATVRWGNGTTDYDILAAKSIAANDVYIPDLPPVPLRNGYTVKVTSGSGNALTFTLVVVSEGSTLYGSSGIPN